MNRELYKCTHRIIIGELLVNGGRSDENFVQIVQINVEVDVRRRRAIFFEAVLFALVFDR